MKINKYLLAIFTNLWLLQAFAQGDTVPKTKLLTDRYSYVSGDRAFIKIYSHCNSVVAIPDQTVYIDLVTLSMEFISGDILRMQHGRASGYFEIPDTLQSGKYIVRVYSDLSKENTLKPLDSKIIYVSNRFGKNEAIFTPAELTNTDSVLLKTPEFEYQCTLNPDKLRTGKRKKITVKIDLQNKPGLDTVWATVSVKPLSRTEQRLEQVNNTHPNENAGPMPCQHSDIIPGVKLQGKAYLADSSTPLQDASVILTLQDTILRLKYDITDTNGDFCFYMQNTYGTHTLYLTAFNKQTMEALANVTFALEPFFIQNTPDKQPEQTIFGYRASDDTLNILKSVVSKAYQNNYFVFTAMNQRNANAYAHKFLTGAFNDIVYPEHFVPLNDFAEIAKEILPFIRYKKTDAGYRFSVIDGINHTVKTKPLVFVDGVPLMEPQKLANYNTPKIKRVDVKAQTRIYGDLFLEDGVIEIWTSEHNFWSLNDSKFNHPFEVKLYQNPIQFQFPDYSKPAQANLPDFRQTLYWNPELRVLKNQTQAFSFYTSDETGIFEITLQGFTSDGQAINARKLLIVE